MKEIKVYLIGALAAIIAFSGVGIIFLKPIADLNTNNTIGLILALVGAMFLFMGQGLALTIPEESQ